MRVLLPAMLVVVMCTSAALGQSGAPTMDRSGKGAVLCGWGILVGVQTQSEVCGWEPVPMDAAIDQAISATEDFIVENSTAPITLDDLAAAREDQAKHYTPDSCQFDPEEPDSFAAMAWSIRERDPDAFLRSVADSLSVPREPLMNPCL